MLTLTAKERKNVSKKENTRLRQEGDIPAVLYGAKEQSMAISVPRVVFEKVWKEAGESSVVSIEGLGETKEALIHDVDIDPVEGVARHADFYALDKTKKVEVRTPLSFVGTAPAEKDLGGALIKVLHDISIEALPKDLPHEIVVDISVLTDFETQILAKDVVLPSGVTLMENPEEVVALVAEPKEETEEAPVFDPNAVQLSVEKGKEEDAEGGETEEK